MHFVLGCGFDQNTKGLLDKKVHMFRALWFSGPIAAMARAQMNTTVSFDTSPYMFPQSNMSLPITPDVSDATLFF